MSEATAAVPQAQRQPSKGGGAAPVRRDHADRVETLAREIYLAYVTSAAMTGKTTEHMANEAFDDAEAFWAAADKRRR